MVGGEDRDELTLLYEELINTRRLANILYLKCGDLMERVEIILHRQKENEGDHGKPGTISSITRTGPTRAPDEQDGEPAPDLPTC